MRRTHFPHLKMDSIPSSVDYVIVGDGSIGCALASRFQSLLSSISILILEAGNNPRPEEVIISPLGAISLVASSVCELR